MAHLAGRSPTVRRTYPPRNVLLNITGSATARSDVAKVSSPIFLPLATLSRRPFRLDRLPAAYTSSSDINFTARPPGSPRTTNSYDPLRARFDLERCKWYQKFSINAIMCHEFVENRQCSYIDDVSFVQIICTKYSSCTEKKKCYWKL